MKNAHLLILLSFLLFNTWSCTETLEEEVKEEQKASTNPLMGAWEMKAVHWKTTDTTYTIATAQPGIFIFTANKYSIQWTPNEEPRTPFQILSKPTDEELIAGFRSVVFNAGSYEMTDSTVTATAFIAKVPGFEGGIQYYRYTIKDDELSLTMFDETYPDGKKPEWFGRYVTEFVMQKVD